MKLIVQLFICSHQTILYFKKLRDNQGISRYFNTLSDLGCKEKEGKEEEGTNGVQSTLMNDDDGYDNK